MSDDFDFDNATPGDLRRALEKANEKARAAEKAQKDAEDRAHAAEAKVKSSSIRDILVDAKIDPKFARLADRDGIEATPEAVSKWVDENKDFYNFGAAKESEKEPGAQEQEPPAQQLDPNLVANLQRQEAILSGAPQSGSITTPEDLIGDLAKGASSRDDFLAKLRELGAPGL